MEKDTGKKMAARGEGLEVARETWGIAEVFSVFTYKGLNVGRGTLGWTGVCQWLVENWILKRYHRGTTTI